MRRSILQWAALAAGALGTVGAASCDSMTTLGNGDNSVSDSGGGGDDGGADAAGPCAYTDDKSFCACMKWTCGGNTTPDSTGTNQTVYCGSCSNDQYCQPGAAGVGIGTCGGTNPLTYAWQKQKIDMLVSMGENDSTTVAYGLASNINDGRGYTIGKVGFNSGTGDFIMVAACYNDLKPGNVLSKYWGHRDASGTAVDGLLYYSDQALITGANQGDTKRIDSLGNFVADVATAAAETDGIFRKCQDSMADALYLSAAVQHAADRGLTGPMTIGFLYHTELNFGEDDDADAGTLGTKSIMKNADNDYGTGLPPSFAGKTWEESKWLGFLIKERVIVMARDKTWQTDIDQNSTWEAARRLHTGASNSPETNTDLGMGYDLISKYKAGSPSAGTPCWTSGLATTLDTLSSIFIVGIDKSASATDETQWTAKGTLLSTGTYASCPANPTP